MKNLLIGEEVYRVSEKEFKDFEYYDRPLTRNIFAYDMNQLIYSIKQKRKKVLKINGKVKL